MDFRSSSRRDGARPLRLSCGQAAEWQCCDKWARAATASEIEDRQGGAEVLQDEIAGTIVADRATTVGTRLIDGPNQINQIKLPPTVAGENDLPVTGIIVAGVILLVSDGAHAESCPSTSTARLSRSATMSLRLVRVSYISTLPTTA